MNYLTTKLSSAHKRDQFHCGVESLDNYIKLQVSQDVRKKLAACFVLADEKNKVIGYYTLSSFSIPKVSVSAAVQKKVPKAYADLPVTLLGRLAVDVSAKGRKLGEKLLLDAMKRSYDITASIASMALVVDPVNDEAVTFYRKYGFMLLESGKMFLPMQTIAQLFE